MIPSMESWKSEVQYINSRCGFCAMTFSKWQDRVDHLAKEFRNGATMKDWKGCRGLDPQVAAHVVNAMPPYLIGDESKSPFPFSASNVGSMKVCSILISIFFSKPKSDYVSSSTVLRWTKATWHTSWRQMDLQPPFPIKKVSLSHS